MSNNKPNFYVYGEADRGRRPPQLIRIGAAWAHKEGSGVAIQVDSLPLNFNGRIVLFEPKADGRGEGPSDAGSFEGTSGEEA
jgi:hypothetical protein